jgi:hypothetical protein
MMLDAQNVFTYTSATDDGQALGSGATGVVSYNQLDLGQGTYANGVNGATPVRSPGNGQPLFLITKIVTTGTGTTPSLEVKLVGSTDADFTASRIVARSGVVAAARVPAGTLLVMPVPPSLGYRYWRVEYTQANTDNAWKVKTFFADMAPTPLLDLGPAYLA